VNGTVTGFDEAVGLGFVESDEQRYRFHCTQIADGSRTIEVGRAVTFTLIPGRRGEWEAAAVGADR
jgi:cold shock CspA family protein